MNAVACVLEPRQGVHYDVRALLEARMGAGGCGLHIVLFLGE